MASTPGIFQAGVDLEDPAGNDEEQIPFPSSPLPDTPASKSSSSNSQSTSSDKLADLPSPFPSPASRPTRAFHRSLENTGSVSAPDVRGSPSGSPRLVPISQSASDGTVGRETPPRQRVSFESDRMSLPNLPGPRQAVRPAHVGSSEPVLPSSHGTFSALAGIRSAHSSLQQEHHGRGHSHARSTSNESPARSHSRHTSPLRALIDRWPTLHRARSREEPFVPIDPYRLRAPFFSFVHCIGRRDSDSIASCEGPPVCRCIPIFHSHTFHRSHIFFLETFPRHVYLHLLLRFPSMYFSRVAKIFQEAEVSRPDIQRIVEACAPLESAEAAQRIDAGTAVRLPFPEDWSVPVVSPALARFKHSWEIFVDSLIKEWKTLNVVSALLLSAILTMFQIPSAANDPVTRTAALISLISAIMSLSYGCVYIVRFGTMRSMHRASRWADEARRSKTGVFWNVWVLLALPGVWLAWAMIAFLVAVLSFVWRTGSTADPTDDDQLARELSPSQSLGPRVTITCILALGLIYFALIIQTFRSYGASTLVKEGTHRALRMGGLHGLHRRNRSERDVERGERESFDEDRGRGRARDIGRDVKMSAMGLGLSGVSSEKTNGEVGAEKEKEKGGEVTEEEGRASGSVSPFRI